MAHQLRSPHAPGLNISMITFWGTSFVTDQRDDHGGMILQFARMYDRNCFINLDKTAESNFGGLIGSGLQTLNFNTALFFRLELPCSHGLGDLAWTTCAGRGRCAR